MKTLWTSLAVLLLTHTILQINKIPYQFSEISNQYKYTSQIISCIVNRYCVTDLNQIWYFLPNLISICVNQILLIINIVGLVFLIIKRQFTFNKFLVFSFTYLFIINCILFVLSFIVIVIDYPIIGYGFYTRIITFIIAVLYTIFYFKYIKDKSQNDLDSSPTMRVRFLNALFDSLFILIISLQVKFILFIYLKNISFIFVIFITSTLYYVLLELIFRQTLGKVITNSSVSYLNSPFRNVFIRTATRFIPLDPFTFILGKKRRWHDRFSKTKILKNNR